MNLYFIFRHIPREATLRRLRRLWIHVQDKEITEGEIRDMADARTFSKPSDIARDLPWWSLKGILTAPSFMDNLVPDSQWVRFLIDPVLTVFAVDKRPMPRSELEAWFSGINVQPGDRDHRGWAVRCIHWGED